MKINLKPLTCETARDMMFDYIEGELKAADALRLEAHLRDCDACRKELSERQDILKLINTCGETPPVSLKLGVMDKINAVPQETKKQRMIKRLLPTGVLSAAAAAVMLFVVGRVFLLGGAMNDADYAAFDKAANAEIMGGGAPAEMEYAKEDAVRDGMMMLADKASTQPECENGANAPQTEASAVEYYTVTSALKAASPGFGLIITDACDYASFNHVENATEAPVKYAMATSVAPSPIDSLFEKFRQGERAIIVCSESEISTPDNFSGEETILFGDTEFRHLTFTENAEKLFGEILDNFERIGAYYRAAAPENTFTELDLFLAVVSEEDAQ